jgi:hypothetical protein
MAKKKLKSFLAVVGVHAGLTSEHYTYQPVLAPTKEVAEQIIEQVIAEGKENHWFTVKNQKAYLDRVIPMPKAVGNFFNGALYHDYINDHFPRFDAIKGN